MRYLPAFLVLALCVAFLAACGESKPALTPEQETFARQTEDSFAKLRADVEKVVADARKLAESNKDLQAALDSLNTALADARKAVENLRSSNTSWETRKAAVESALKDLAAKSTETLAKTKLGGIQLPKF